MFSISRSATKLSSWCENFYQIKILLGVNPGAIIAKFRGLCKTIDDVRGAFKQFDVDGDGNISRQVFRQKNTH